MKNRIKTSPYPAVKTVAAAERALAEIAGATLKLRGLEAERDARALALETDFSDRFHRLQTDIDTRSAALQTWAAQHPELFSEKKSIEFPGGTLGYRTGTPELRLRPGFTWDQVLKKLKSLRLTTFVRVRESVNKEALIAERGDQALLKRAGVEVAQEETFFVAPGS
jgi:phage host-nuclease inhibitor protein Gam